jgi:hypothetical protein
MAYSTHKIRDFGLGIYTSLQSAVKSLKGQGFRERHVGPNGERRFTHARVTDLYLDVSEDKRFGLCYVTVKHNTSRESHNLLKRLVIG